MLLLKKLETKSLQHNIWEQKQKNSWWNINWWATSFKQYHKLNPINIKINDNQIISFSKSQKYCLKITSLLLGGSFN